MPYSNVPEALQDKMESCVKHLKSKGKSGDSVYKICYSQVVGKGVAHEAKQKKEAMNRGKQSGD
jgi:hypothetical protein